MPVVGPATMVASSAAPSLSLSSFSFEGVVNTIKAQVSSLMSCYLWVIMNIAESRFFILNFLLFQGIAILNI